MRRAVILLTGTVLASRLVGPAMAAPFGYVANHGDGTVSVVDTATNSVVATVTVGNQPLGAAVNENGTRVFVTNQVTPIGSVSVIDATTNTVSATVVVGSGPSGAAVKLPGDRLYVTNRDDKTVSVIDTTTLTVVATPTVGNNPLGVAVNPAGNPAYVVNKGSNNVSVIDTSDDTVTATIPVGNDPTHVAVSPNGRRAYVSNGSNASVSVIDTDSNSVVATVTVGNIPEGVVVDPSGARLYVANSGPNSVSVVDTASNTVIATVPVGLTPFELAVRPDGARVFVANRQSDNVSVIDTATNTVTATVPAGQEATGFGQFIAPALQTPRFGAVARKCQVALTRQAIKLVKLHHGLESTCRLGVIKAEAAGQGTGAAEAACLKALDAANPLSKLSRARTKLRAAVAKACATVLPLQINGPCARSAPTIGATVDCLLAQHATRVATMVGNEFSLARPVPLVGAAQACQNTLAKSGRRFADRLHKELGSCLEKVLLAAEKGKGDAKAVASCLAKLDLGNPFSKASAARAAGLVAIARKCTAVAPSDIGSPCKPGAATSAETATCVLDAHRDAVAKLIAAEHNDACPMLTRLGLGRAYLQVCSGLP